MTRASRPLLLAAIGATALAQSACAQSSESYGGEPNAPDAQPAFSEQTRAPLTSSGVDVAVETLAEGLEHPWGMDLLPDGALLVTERSGQLRVVSPDGTVSDPVEGVPQVLDEGQGGLLDVAVGPDFASDRRIYLTYSKPLGEGTSATAAASGVLSADNTALTEVTDIFVQEPPSPSPMHYGSRIVFDGMRHAFVTTGEHYTEIEREYAQDLDKTYGKVVRVALDGSVPPDNPFVDEAGAIPTIWSYGHRNIQGAAIHPDTGALWTVEHGAQGGDELNIPQAGANYGWPVISYGENYDGTPVGSGETAQDGMEQPRYYWDPVIAPGGMLFYEGEMFEAWQGDVLIASLNPGSLVRLELEGDTVVGEERLLTDQGRIRDVMEAPDGALLVLTDADNGAVLRLTPDLVSEN